MFKVADLFQWERFITPAIIKLFYWLLVAMALATGIYGFSLAIGLLAVAPVPALLLMVASLFGIVLGVVLARIVAEFILIVFRINEHLGAIRGAATGFGTR